MPVFPPPKIRRRAPINHRNRQADFFLPFDGPEIPQGVQNPNSEGGEE